MEERLASGGANLSSAQQEPFGLEKRKQVETFLRLQAQLGLKTKARSMTPDAKLCAELGDEIAGMREQVDDFTP